MINSVCILGGGTSGLITALVLKRWYPLLDVTVVESSSIGIVGVGEGSTEHWSQLMKVLEIPLKELVSETGATFKTGIKFENWLGDGSFYFHSLQTNYSEMIQSGIPAITIQLMVDNAKHLTPDSIVKSEHYLPLAGSVNQYHFDTFKLNKFFHKKCIEKNIKIVDDDIIDVALDEQGFVSSLVSSSQKYSADFFVDSSGFKRIIANKLGIKWKDCGDHLPMNRAFAFPSPGEENIPSHTLSRALSSGWMWRIPTQERYGNGYVFSDNFITEDQAVAEIQKYYSTPVEIGRSFKFSAGYVDKFWVKNCVCIGLSGSFVEPLEATSIGTSIQQAFGLGAALINWSREVPNAADYYNKNFFKVAQNIIDFVQLHYITTRNDTEFWRSCKDIKLTEFNQETLEYFRNSIPSRALFLEPFILFGEQNWIQVLYGLKQFNMKRISEIWSKQDPFLINEIKNKLQDLEMFLKTEKVFSHREALNFIQSDKFNE